MEIGFGPSHVLLPNSGMARPGHAGGGCDCTEQETLLLETVPPHSFLLKERPP